MANNDITFFTENWKENKEYLNWPGLQYLWYTKIKPAISEGIDIRDSYKVRIDDENWYISYDASVNETLAKTIRFNTNVSLTDNENGIVYISLNDDNSVFVYDQDGSCGTVKDNNGMLQVVVDASTSNMLYGFIDDNVGSIGDNSDQIGDATGKLYVVFDTNYEYSGNYTDEDWQERYGDLYWM